MKAHTIYDAFMLYTISYCTLREFFFQSSRIPKVSRIRIKRNQIYQTSWLNVIGLVILKFHNYILTFTSLFKRNSCISWKMQNVTFKSHNWPN